MLLQASNGCFFDCVRLTVGGRRRLICGACGDLTGQRPAVGSGRNGAAIRPRAKNESHLRRGSSPPYPIVFVLAAAVGPRQIGPALQAVVDKRQTRKTPY